VATFWLFDVEGTVDIFFFVKTKQEVPGFLSLFRSNYILL
jgi:hypothetical protein